MSRQSDHRIQEMVPVVRTAATEELKIILENKDSRTVDVTISYLSDTGRELDTKRVLIQGTYYDALMSEFPEFSPTKPAHEYREVDLWFIIDAAVSGESVSILEMEGDKGAGG